MDWSLRGAVDRHIAWDDWENTEGFADCRNCSGRPGVLSDTET